MEATYSCGGPLPASRHGARPLGGSENRPLKYSLALWLRQRPPWQGGAATHTHTHRCECIYVHTYIVTQTGMKKVKASSYNKCFLFIQT